MSQSHISFEELTKTLQNAGLPMDSAFNMRQAKPMAREAISGQIGDKGAGDFGKGIMAQLEQIHQMDQKLAGVYSDPTSNLYIENAAAREGAIYGHRDTGFSQISSLADERNNRLQERDDEIETAESLYGDLTTAQAQLESEEKRLVSQTKKATTEAEKNSRIVKDESGETAFELTKQQARQARNAKINLKDAKAVSEFFNRSTPEFRKYMEDEGLDGKIKGENLTAKQIAELRKKWEGQKQTDSVKKAVSKANEKANMGSTGKSLF